jgi:hypothetical protein
MIKSCNNCASVFELFSQKVMQDGYNTEIISLQTAFFRNFESM